jgi:hypothetical protein
MRRQQATATSGLDIARSIFQAYGVPAAGQVVAHRLSKRRYVLLVFQKLPLCCLC